MTISGDVLVHRVAGILNEQGKPPHDSTILGAISKLSWYEMEHICEFDRASKSSESPGTVPPEAGAANTGMAAEAAKIADEMDTVIIRLNKPHGEIDWPYVISEWRRRLRHA
jgi:hypothetical protein